MDLGIFSTSISSTPRADIPRQSINLNIKLMKTRLRHFMLMVAFTLCALPVAHPATASANYPDEAAGFGTLAFGYVSGAG